MALKIITKYSNERRASINISIMNMEKDSSVWAVKTTFGKQFSVRSSHELKGLTYILLKNFNNLGCVEF